MRDQMQAIAEAPRASRGPLRMVLARTMLANRLSAEALGVLKATFVDDPVLAGQRDIPMLIVIGNAGMGRAADMRTQLAAEILRNDPEARLWQGYLEAIEGRWSATAGVLDRYPDDLQARLRTAAAEAAIETGDWDAANRQIIAAVRAADQPTLERLALLRARIDEVTGQTMAA
ncbi:hypothetical protein, partial [Sphingomonas sp.]|uniref:hypothetical protein n=1 Tax=Sphingomonas sp. TaxID=28214 RepID=UPI002582A4F5